MSVVVRLVLRWLGRLLQLSPYVLAGLLWAEDGSEAWTAAVIFAFADAVFNFVLRIPWISLVSAFKGNRPASWLLLFSYKSFIAWACLWTVHSVQELQGYPNPLWTALGMGLLFVTGAALTAYSSGRLSQISAELKTTGSGNSEQDNSN